MQQFTLLSPDGTLRVGSLDELTALATREGKTPVVVGGTHSERTENGRPGRLTPSQAFAKSGLPQLDLSEVMRIPVKAAADRLRYPLFETFHQLPEGVRQTKSGIPGVMRHDRLMSNLFLRDNAKMQKVGGMNIVGLGLVLEPHNLTYGPRPPTGSKEVEEWVSSAPGERSTSVEITSRDERGPLLPWDVLGVPTSRIAALSRGSACVGSSADCRNTCLLTSGQNWSDMAATSSGRPYERATPYLRSVPYNRALKKALATAVLAYPAESARLLLYAIERKQRAARRAGLELTVRLNVLSDYPWELILPGLFLPGERPAWFEDSPVHFYDYTKIPGRMPDPSQYHLVFSYSGVNWDECREELAYRNVVLPIVGVAKGRPREELIQGVYQSYRLVPEKGTGGTNKGKELLKFPAEISLPGVGNLPLLDGDQYDARWADPIKRGAVIGLRFKLPMNSLIRYDVSKMAFIVKVRRLGDVFVVEQTPGLTGATFGNVDPDTGDAPNLL